MERSQKRQKVAKAAKEANVIDLTGNEIEGGRAHRPQPRTATTHQYPQSDVYVPATESSRSAATRDLSSASAGLHLNDGLVALPTVWTTSTPFQHQQSPQPEYQTATSVQASKDFSQLPNFNYTSTQDVWHQSSSHHEISSAPFESSFTHYWPSNFDVHQAAAYY
jgi:hypothetical protein